MTATQKALDAAPADSITSPLIALFGVSVGIIVTNLFAPQTLVGLIGPSVGLAGNGRGLISTATLLGYAAGLFLLVPLADLMENRALVLRLLSGAALAAATAVMAPSAAPLFVALFVLGAACSAIQVLVPVAASMAPPERRGRVIGDVMGGLMVGILLARPLASVIAGEWGWRAFYGASAVTLVALTAVLALFLPKRAPEARTSYGALIGSLGTLLRREPVLRQRALTASLAMAAFSLFWTSVALRLAEAPFELGQRGMALFALVGAGGAIVTPLAGRAGDRGWTRPATIASHLALIGALALAAWAGAADAHSPSLLPLIIMGGSAIVLDVGVTGDQTLGRRAINLLQPQARSRINGVFVGLFFLGGALGSACAGLAWSWGGWHAVCGLGAVFGAAALASELINGTVR